MKRMRCVFMGKHKRSAVSGLGFLAGSDWEILAVVAPPPSDALAPPQRLDYAAGRFHLPLVTDDDLYAALERPEESDLDLTDVDVVFSFLFWKKIRPPLIHLGREGCINFHPAPLPDMRGLGGYNVAILEEWPEWGVSVHYVDEELDTGDLIRVDRFPIKRDRETALSLDVRSQYALLDAFRWTVDELFHRRPLPRLPQGGGGRYVTREEFESLRVVDPGDPPELTARRIRAFWYPPHDGATLEVNGQTLTLLDRNLLPHVARAYRNAGIQA